MATWGDYSLRKLIKDIIKYRPPFSISNIVDTSSTGVLLSTTSNGFAFFLQKQNAEGTWVREGAVRASNYESINTSISAITETSRCRFEIYPYGIAGVYYSNEFTVTRTAAQTQTLKQNLESGKLDSEVFETDVVEPVVEKTTTTKSK